MGCWNETDGVTQLPINYGDRVRVFILVHQENLYLENHSGGGTCSTEDRWSPIGPAIEGTYDDYGGIENIIENFNSQLILSTLKQFWIQPSDKYEWDKVPSLDDMTLKDFVHFIERDRGTIYHNGHELELGIFFVLEDVYQSMVNFDVIEAHHYKHRHFIYRPYSQSLQIDLQKTYSSLASFNVLTDMSDLLIMITENRFFASYKDFGVKVFKDPLIAYVKEKLPWENDKVQELTNSMIEYVIFTGSMCRARKIWVPQTGKGGQHNELDIYKTLSTVTNKIISEREKQEIEAGIETPDKDGYYPYMIEHNQKEITSENTEQISSQKT